MSNLDWLTKESASNDSFSNKFSQHHWQESFYDDSFASQSRFDAYADYSTFNSLTSARTRLLLSRLGLHSNRKYVVGHSAIFKDSLHWVFEHIDRA